MKQRCADVANLEIVEVSSNPLAAALAVRGSRLAHSHEARTVYSCLLANLLYGIPYVITRRVVAPQSSKYLRRKAYRRAGQLVGVSRAVAESIRERFQEAEAMVIPDASAGFAVDEREVARIRARYPGKTLIGHVGALAHSHKGQSTIIAAAHQCAELYPDWHFLLCGDGQDEQRFRNEIGKLSNIELVGWIDNVGDWLASFDLFVYPSLHEALGSTLLDAMQLGLPIVASNVGGIPDFVVDGINGSLIDPEHPEQIIGALARLLADSGRLQVMQEANKAAAQQYDVAHMTEAYAVVYASIST
ncbi:MAG: glycosyltransferase family 4 protein [Gammaproteobacteria bacterium]|nr:glycosyltransferase family 4 protein [Gammaproteobacteria bacterium]